MITSLFIILRNMSERGKYNSEIKEIALKQSAEDIGQAHDFLSDKNVIVPDN